MKKSKQEKTSEGEDGVDMVSNLPDHILESILSHIPTTEELIRTSILSRRWRHLWTSIPSIDIDYTRGLDSLNRLDSNGFKDFVYWVLLNKPMNVDTFRLWCADCYNMSNITRWIHAAVVRKVKRLDLMFCPIDESEIIEVPHCLATCGSLEVLKLCLLGSYLSVPKFKGFSALRVLELNDIEFKGDNNLVEYFLESCPLLEDLSLIDCMAEDLIISSAKLKNLRIASQKREYNEDLEEFDDCVMGLDLEILCPKLEFLSLTGSLAYNYFFENLYSLKKAVIHIKEFFDYDEPTFDVFDEISHVESLSISLYCVDQFYDPRVDEPISLPNLKTLEITVDALHILIPFLKCFPDLESLHLIFIKYTYGLEELALEEPVRMSILTCHLKKVEFLEFDEEKPKMDVARALLNNGNELEEMVFSWVDEAKFHERSRMAMNEVSKFHKASSFVKIRGVVNPSQDNSRWD